MYNTLNRIYNTLDLKKAKDIGIIDITGVSVISDFFIIATGDNSVHTSSLSNIVYKDLTEIDLKPKMIEKDKNNSWIVMDYGNFIIHLFEKKTREYYNIDKLWMDGKVIEIK